MKEQFYRFCAVMNFVFTFATFGGYETDMFSFGRRFLQMIFFFGGAVVFGILAENEYYKKQEKKRKKENEKRN